jgi:DNA-binding GntR family transcriptional regulator
MGVPTLAADEHWQIVKALECKDVAKARSLLKRHIKNTGGDVRRDRMRKPAPASEAPAAEVRLRRD